ncbi:unnamed protein product [Mycena citricolor]|uniref:Uncharacterized protein n=1 Tax=Mycena citricolor TaxID=2018698 RepID=A0AAD2GU31_9AGAR|nr:unnamed protein product [Mycena citricolor]
MASDSSASTTPLILTPDSTGIVEADPSGNSSTQLRKSRRQTAFYPHVNSSNKTQKPFSRSAAKRESVMALGSIEHLQHYFTKTGIEAKKSSKAGKGIHGLVPVFGGLTHGRTDSVESAYADLPPSPVIPQPPVQAFPPYVKTYEMDPESLLPGVIDDLSDVAFAWNIDQTAPQTKSFALLSVGSSSNYVDVLKVLQTTTRAIRSVRNYLLSLPDESAGTIRAQFRSRHLPGSFRPAMSSSLASSRSITDLRAAAAAAKEKEKEKEKDPLSLIRRAALEVLTVLRDLEERCRLPLSDDAYDAQSDRGSRGGHSRIASPNMLSDVPLPDGGSSFDHDEHHDHDGNVAFSLVQVNGRFESVPVWEDEDSVVWDDEDDNKVKKEGWDEKLVLGSGWLYRQDVTLEALGRERGMVSAYLDVVDEVIFEGKKAENERGWARERRKASEKGSVRSRSRDTRRAHSSDDGSVFTSNSAEKAKRRVSMGMFEMMSALKVTAEPGQIDEIDEESDGTEESVDDDDLPEWARRAAFENDELGRAHSLLASSLPPNLVGALAPSTSRLKFLESLSSGQLLSVAYNTCVRKSKKPWGYISPDGIHDILALEAATGDGESKKGWTFRRIDNLRLWGGALKIRYMLPITAPPSGTTPLGTPLNSPSIQQRFNPGQPPVVFDAKIVARQDAGWDEILEGVILRWMQRVVAEKRGEA